MATTEVTAQNYDEIIALPYPVLIDFFAPWCGHCQQLMPTIDGLAEEVGHKAAICKLNVDEFREKAVEFGIRTVPTLILLKNGQEVNRLLGNKSKDEILEALARCS